MKNIKIIKNRSDIGAGTRGSDMGIDAMEIAAINENNHYFNQFEFVDVETENEAIYKEVNTPKAKRIKNIVSVCTRLNYTVKSVLEGNEFPLVLSGDHSSALGTISGVKNAFPEKRIGVVWIDAHADIHSPYTTPSGNVHGMPLAAALAEDNMDRQINEPNADTVAQWDAMKSIGGIAPKVAAKDVVYFGVRDTEEPEDYIIEKLGIKNYTVEEMRYRGFRLCLEEAVAKLQDCDLIYISFDVDSMDCDIISKGTGTPVSRGYDQFEIKDIIAAFVATNKVACFEVVEVNPTLDTENRMAHAAFDVLHDISEKIKETLD
ncbi:arginase [Aureivirga sp. CE67]|uniref:arginase n=1 Tax=Aureivirga sp. CE67 TaxID=1788983 RepID=UPI0018CA7170|nr:arginase [Aureivirga sp. CE67]